MHYTKAEDLMKKIILDPFILRKENYEVASAIVEKQCKSLEGIFHPDKGLSKNHLEFAEISQIIDQIEVIGFKTIYDALRTAPGKNTKYRKQVVEAKAMATQTRMVLNITNAENEFRDGLKYFYGLVDNALGKFILLTNPSTHYPAKSIDLEAMLNDEKAHPYFINKIESIARRRIPHIKQEIKKYDQENKGLKTVRDNVKETLKIYVPLEEAIKSRSLNEIKKELNALYREDETSEPESERAGQMRLDDLRKSIAGYENNKEYLKNTLIQKRKSLNEFIKLIDAAEKTKNLADLNNILQKANNDSSEYMQKFIMETGKRGVATTLELEEKNNEVYEKVKKKLALRKAQLRKSVRRIKSLPDALEPLLNYLDDRFENKKKAINSIVSRTDKEIETNLNTNLRLGDKITEYENIRSTLTSNPAEQLKKYKDELNIPARAFAESILDFSESINKHGSDEQIKLFKAREYLEKTISVEAKTNPRYTALVALEIDKNLSIGYRVISSIAGKFPFDEKFIPTGRRFAGIINQGALKNPGLPETANPPLMLNAPEGYRADQSAINQETLKHLKFFDNMSNDVSQSHIDCKYLLISVEHNKKESTSIYRVEGTVASTFFRDTKDMIIRSR